MLPLSYQTEQSTGSGAELEDVGGDSAISIARKIHTLQRQSTYSHAVDAIPGANDSPIAHSSADSAPISSYLLFPLPSATEMDELLHKYFDSVHWFSLVLIVPKFSPAYCAIRAGYATPSDKPFLLLLSTILGLSAWYRAHRTSSHSDRDHYRDLSSKMILNAESQIVEIMDQRSITAIQTLILLGSYYVYHGRPNLSFSLVGATIKAAQSLGLHKSCPQASHLDQEERKRVWWTIYTWDRFSSVNYGRPFGISEKVCNVEQPEDTFEEPMVPGNQHQSICYSTYQRELNKLYLIASPAIERVYRADGDQQRRTTKEYHVLVNEVTMRLWQWRRELPEHLCLNIDKDWPASLSAEDKAYRLQSLSLYLTFDSLILVLHRPFMKQRLESIYSTSPAQNVHMTDEQPFTTSETSSHEQLWNASVRTTKITELPQLAQHATDGHLISFLTMNMFNAAVVLIVMALSHPLTDRAQQAKRAVARVYRVQLTLESQSVLCQQSATMLRSLIQMLMSHESNVILAPITMSETRATSEDSQDTVALGTMAVRDALNNPLWRHGEGDMATDSDQFGTVPDTVARLGRGLESVQKAFAEMPDESIGSHHQSRRQSVAPEDLNRHEVLMEYDPRPTVADSKTGIGADMGVHWIWDPVWDNLFDSIQL